MIGHLLCALGLHDWERFGRRYADGTFADHMEVCVRDSCRGRTSRLRIRDLDAEDSPWGGGNDPYDD